MLTKTTETAWLALTALLALAGSLYGQAPLTNALLALPATDTNQPPVDTNAVAIATPPDLAAARYLNTCSGCHSLSGVKLAGPELTHVAAWPQDQLRAAIKRMEKNVGPLPDGEVADLTALLQSTDLRQRLQVEGERIQAQFAAKLAPADPVLGRQLFEGTQPFANQGLACVACHTVGGRGGNLGPDLTGVFGRLGQAPLVSAIQQASFKMMASHYRRHPVTRQEALHLTKFLATLHPGAVAPPPPDFVMAGASGATLLFAGLAFYFRRGRAERRPPLHRRRRG